MENVKPKFNYNGLYELRDALDKQMDRVQVNSGLYKDLLEQIDALDHAIEYIEMMDKDRDAETYAYELTVSQHLMDMAIKDDTTKDLMIMPLRAIKECDWDDTIPTHIRVAGKVIRLQVDINDYDQIIKIYATL